MPILVPTLHDPISRPESETLLSISLLLPLLLLFLLLITVLPAFLCIILGQRWEPITLPFCGLFWGRRQEHITLPFTCPPKFLEISFFLAGPQNLFLQILTSKG